MGSGVCWTNKKEPLLVLFYIYIYNWSMFLYKGFCTKIDVDFIHSGCLMIMLVWNLSSGMNFVSFWLMSLGNIFALVWSFGHKAPSFNPSVGACLWFYFLLSLFPFLYLVLIFFGHLENFVFILPILRFLLLIYMQ